MTILYQQIGLAIVLAWLATVFARPLGLHPRRAALGFVLGAGAVAFLGWTAPVRAIMALLSPPGMILPALAIRNMLRMSGVRIRPFSATEVALALALLILFYCGSAGVLPWDAYRTGYGPWAAPILTAGFCAWGWLRHDIFPPMVALAAQAAWMAGIGSVNIFDHLTHAILVPILALTLAAGAMQAAATRLLRPRATA